MIDGIRIAAFVHSHRRRSRVEGGAQAGYLDCSQCVITHAEKREWNCGHLPRLPDHRGQYPLPESAPRPQCDTCPGYLVSLPAVNESLSAHLWWDKGQLEQWVGDRVADRHLNLYVEVVAGAVADVELDRQTQHHRELSRAKR